MRFHLNQREVSRNLLGCCVSRTERMPGWSDPPCSVTPTPPPMVAPEPVQNAVLPSSGLATNRLPQTPFPQNSQILGELGFCVPLAPMGYASPQNVRKIAASDTEEQSRGGQLRKPGQPRLPIRMLVRRLGKPTGEPFPWCL